MYFLAVSLTHGGTVAENNNVCGLLSANWGKKHFIISREV